MSQATPSTGQPRAVSALMAGLRSWPTLVGVGSANQAASAASSSGSALHHVDDGRLAVRRGQREGVHVTAVRCPGAAHHQTDPAGRRAPASQARTVPVRQPGAGDLETLGAGLVLLREGLQQPLPEHPELQIVEDPVDGLAVVRQRREVGRRVVVDRDLPDQFGQPAVHQHVRQVLPQRVADLAAHLVDPVDQRGEAAELPDPFGRRLLPHPGNAGQVVRRVAAQGRVVGVLQRRQPVLGLHLLGGEPGQLGDAATAGTAP